MVNRNGSKVYSFVQMMSAVKSGAVSHSSFIEMAKREHQVKDLYFLSSVIKPLAHVSTLTNSLTY